MLKKYLWQFLGAVLALGAMFSTYDIYMRSKPVTKLQVTLNSILPLVGERVQISGNLQISSSMELMLNNKVVPNAVIYSVTVANTGNQPITEADYSKPLAFYFSPKDEILEVVCESSNPANIGMSIHRTSAYQAEADPVLLNPGDTVEINFIVAVPEASSLSAHFHIEGRIVGVKEIELVTLPKIIRVSSNLKSVTLFSVIGVLAGIFSSLVYEKLLGSLKKSIHAANKQA
jgi:hypothetical protein